jgi:hypothetical protein
MIVPSCESSASTTIRVTSFRLATSCYRMTASNNQAEDASKPQKDASLDDDGDDLDWAFDSHEEDREENGIAFQRVFGAGQSDPRF